MKRWTLNDRDTTRDEYRKIMVQKEYRKHLLMLMLCPLLSIRKLLVHLKLFDIPRRTSLPIVCFYDKRSNPGVNWHISTTECSLLTKWLICSIRSLSCLGNWLISYWIWVLIFCSKISGYSLLESIILKDLPALAEYFIPATDVDSSLIGKLDICLMCRAGKGFWV